MPNYDNTSTKPTSRQLSTMLRKHIPTAQRQVALQDHTKNKSLNNAANASRVLDVIGIDAIAAALGDDIPVAYICKNLKVTKGQFNSWAFGDKDRARRVSKALNVAAYMKAVQVRSDILQHGDEMTEDDVRRMRLQLSAAKDIEATVVPPESSKDKGESVEINFDFGSLLNN